MRKAIPFLAAALIAANLMPVAATKAAEATPKNNLSSQRSLFYKKHNTNSVDWMPWGVEAFAKAKKENKPVLVSSGFSACHWCDMMNKESFIDPATAALMNKNFVNVIVDREERPDVDAWLAQSLEAMGVMPGWPLTVFLTPEGKPFFGGAYFPPKDAFNLPSFKTVLSTVSERFKTQQAKVNEQSSALVQKMQVVSQNKIAHDLTTDQLEKALNSILAKLDPVYGDLTDKHKHPHVQMISFLLASSTNQNLTPEMRNKCEEAACLTLNHYTWGALRDHLDGGFLRFCVDSRYNRPHFEKMLYDNAMLAGVYFDAYAKTGNKDYLKTAEETEQFISTRLQGPDGQFYASLSADQNGEEGKYYRFSRDEIAQAIGGIDGQAWALALGITKEPRGTTVHLLSSPKQTAQTLKMSDAEFAKTLTVNLDKIRQFRDSKRKDLPVRDDKVLATSNALAISALVKAFKATGDGKYLQQATKCGTFMCSQLISNGSQLKHSLTAPSAAKSEEPAFLDDYAYTIQALLDLASVDLSPKWSNTAKSLTTSMLKQFGDTKLNDLYYSSLAFSQKPPVVPQSDASAEGLTPSPVGVAALDLLRQSITNHDESLEDKATLAIRMHLNRALNMPAFYGTLLSAAVFDKGSKIDIVLSATPKDSSYKELARVLNSAYLPYAQITVEDGQQKGSKPLLKGKPAVYICTKSGCERPITDVEALKKRLKELMLP